MRLKGGQRDSKQDRDSAPRLGGCGPLAGGREQGGESKGASRGPWKLREGPADSLTASKKTRSCSCKEN